MGLPEVARLIGTRFRAGWQDLDPGARRRWVKIVAAGVAGMFGFVLLLVASARALDGSGALAWEESFLRLYLDDAPFSFSTAVWFQTFGTDITLTYLVLATAGIAAWIRRPITALSIVIAYVVLDVAVRVGWAAWERARPTVLLEGFAAPGLHAFPSGHTGKTFVVYGLLIALWVRSTPRWTERMVAVALLIVISILVPLSRMTMGVHWPSDLIAGWLLGAIWLVYLLWALRLEKPAVDRETNDDSGAGHHVSAATRTE